ncbi:MAG: iron ABC transporter permease [Pseudomonadota bacterium]
MEQRTNSGLRTPRFSALRPLPVLISLFLGLPVLAAAWFGVSAGGSETWQHLLGNRLSEFTTTTLLVLLLSGGLMLLIAVPLAWLVSLFDFPGRGIFDWALVLPLAMPGYVMAYAWADLAGVAGPLHAAFRDMTGLSARDYWYPDLFTPGGLAFVLGSTLFPYAYITARSAFINQSLSTLEAARSLGASNIRLFHSVALPAAAPAIFAGLSLGLMEAAADYGAADFLGIQTLGVGIVRAWASFGEPAAAARLALILVSIAFTLLIAARFLQGSSVQETSNRLLAPTRQPLHGVYRWAAPGICLTVVLITFALPVSRLIWLSLETGTGFDGLWMPLRSSLVFGIAGALLALTLAITLVQSNQTARRMAWLSRLSSAAGYAAPGAVLGLGGLFMLQALDLSLTGAAAVLLLIWIYATRFTAAGIEPITAALARTPKSLGMASRSYNTSWAYRFRRIDLPLMAPGILAGALILFVETLKELPATLMLRPFGWDTLAVKAHNYATDERLAEAMLPSLMITLAGLLPVILLSRQMNRTGHRIS